MTKMQQYNFTYNDIHNSIRNTAKTIAEVAYQPDYLLAIGGGGLIPARIMRTYINRPILIVSLSRYSDETGTAPANQPIKLQWLETDIDLTDKKVLVIDEVEDERTSLEFTLQHLFDSHPGAEFSAFVVHNKKKDKKEQLPESLKHFFVDEEIEDYTMTEKRGEFLSHCPGIISTFVSRLAYVEDCIKMKCRCYFGTNP